MAAEIEDWSTHCGQQGSLHEWNQAVRMHLADARFDAVKPEEFIGSITMRNLGDMALTAVQTSACRVMLKTGHELPFGGRRFALHYIRDGKLDFEQGNQRVVAGQGDFVLLDNFRDYTLRTARGVRCVSMDVSESWLKCQLFDPFSCLMTKIDKSNIWAQTFGFMLTSMADTPDRASLARHNLISEQAGGFITLLFDKQDDLATTHRTRVKQHIMEVLRGCYIDPEVKPDDIAKIVGISKRSLHLTLADAGTTFSTELMRLRLEQARRMLKNEEFATLSIAEIAWRCGYLDASYFTRCFSRYEGRSPTMFRLEGRRNRP